MPKGDTSGLPPWSVTIVSELADPSTREAARSKARDILLRGTVLRGTPGNPVDAPLDQLKLALEGLDPGKLLDELVAQLGAGGLTRLAEFFGVSAARMSGWRGSAPSGVAEMMLLWLILLWDSSMQSAEQSHRADDLSHAEPSRLQALAALAKGPVGLPWAGAAMGVVLGASLAEQIVALARTMPKTNPLKIVMATSPIKIDLSPDAVAPRVSSNSKIVFMGEAPGAAESISGLPFVGPSGLLLMDAIRDATKSETIDVDEIGFTNVFQTRPNNNKVAEFFGPAKSETTISDLPPCAYGHLLIDQLPALRLNAEVLEQAKPKVIVALGAIAAWALLGRYDIGNFRGTFSTIDYGPFKAQVMATYHPAYVLRDRRRFEVFASDITSAFEQMRRASTEPSAARAGV